MPHFMLPLAVQLHTVRQTPEPFDKVLSDIAAIGYRGVETVGDQGLLSEELRRLLDRHALQLVSTHVKLIELEEGLAEIIAFNQVMDNDTLVISSLPLALRPQEAAGWVAVGRRLNKLGQACRDHGMRLLYHNHDFEMMICDGRPAIEWLLEGADAVNLGFEPDLASIVAGHADPVNVLARLRGRCPRIHVKDLVQPELADNDIGVADVGDGVLDWASLLPLVRESGAEWLVVEHDLPTDPLRSIRRSFDYLSTHWEN